MRQRKETQGTSASQEKRERGIGSSESASGWGGVSGADRQYPIGRVQLGGGSAAGDRDDVSARTPPDDLRSQAAAHMVNVTSHAVT